MFKQGEAEKCQANRRDIFVVCWSLLVICIGIAGAIVWHLQSLDGPSKQGGDLSSREWAPLLFYVAWIKFDGKAKLDDGQVQQEAKVNAMNLYRADIHQRQQADLVINQQITSWKKQSALRRREKRDLQTLLRPSQLVVDHLNRPSSLLRIRRVVNNQRPTTVVLTTDKNKHVKDGDVLFIDYTPAMPILKAESPDDYYVTWTISFEYHAPFKSAIKFNFGVFGRSTHNTSFDIVAALKGKIYGGTVTASWYVLGKGTGQITFTINGRQPEKETIMKYIDSRTTLWYAKPIAKTESYGGEQFEKDKAGPLFREDNGYGIYQLTNPEPTYDQVFSWKSNVDEGISRLEKLAQAATKKMKERRAAAKYLTVPEQHAGKCVFRDNSKTPIEGAVAIKRYNGAVFDYCSWNDTLMPHRWQFNHFTIIDGKEVNRDYVLKVCNNIDP